MKKLILHVMITVLLVRAFAVGQRLASSDNVHTSHFAYDRTLPLQVAELSSQVLDGIRVVDLTFAGYKSQMVPAYVVIPAGEGPFPAVLFAHWIAPAILNGNRSEFLLEALWLARLGAASLLLDLSQVRSTESRRPPTPDDHRHDDEVVIGNVIDLRRALDLLQSHPQIRATRIAYVGHSTGADLGAILAGIENNRVKATVIMAGTLQLTEMLRSTTRPEIAAARQANPEAFARYIAAMKPFDAYEYIGSAAPNPVYLQFGDHDGYVVSNMGKQWYAAAKQPKTLAVYESGHELSMRALSDRQRWLKRHLRLRETR